MGVRIALGQINVTVGDLDGNVAKMASWAARATEAGADLVCFPELSVTGLIAQAAATVGVAATIFP